MIKKILTITLAAAFAVAFFGCKKSGQYADLKEYLNDFINFQEEYVSALEKANSAKDVAEAMTEMGNKMEKIAKKGESLKTRYPDLNKMRKEPPAEIKDELEKLTKVTQRWLTVSMKNMKYMMDPEVLKASQEMARKMGGTNIFK